MQLLFFEFALDAVIDAHFASQLYPKIKNPFLIIIFNLLPEETDQLIKKSPLVNFIDNISWKL